MAGNDLNMRLSLQLAEKVSGPLKGISNSSRTAAGSLQATRNSLRELERQNGIVQRLRQQQAAFAATSNQLKIHQAQLQSMRNSGSATAAQIKTQTALVDKSTAAFKKQAAQLGALRAQANNAGIGNLSTAQARLGTEIARTTQQLRQQEQALRRTEQLRTQRNNGLMRAGAIGATGLGMRLAGQRGLTTAGRFMGAGVEFDATMSRVQALTRLDNNSVELAMLRQQADDLGANTAFTATQAAQGQAFLAMAGFTPQSIHAAMPGLLDMALAGDIDLARTADIASNISSGFGIDPAEMNRVADVLTMAFTNSNVSLEMLGETMKYMAPTARAAGVSLEEAAAMAGLLGNVGIQGSSAGTVLRGMLTRLSNTQSDTLKSLGVQAADAQGNLREVPDILMDIDKATRHLGTAERLTVLKSLFDVRAMSGASELLERVAAGDLQRFTSLLHDSQGTAADVARTQADQLRGDWVKLTSAWEGLGISFNELITDDLRSLTQWLTTVTVSIRAWTKENPELAKWIGRIVLGSLALSTVLGTVLTALAPLIGGFVMFRYAMGIIGVKGLGLAGIVTKLGGVFKALGTAIAANPMMALLAVIALTVYAIIKNWDTITWFFSDFWENFGGMFRWGLSNLWELVKNIFGFIIDTAIQLGMSVWNEITSAFDGGIAGISALIINWSPIGLFYKAFAAVLNWFGFDLPADFTTFASNILGSLGEGILEHGPMLLGWFGEMFSDVFSWFTDDLPAHFLEFGGMLMQSLVKGVTNALGYVKNTITNAGRSILNWFREKLGIATQPGEMHNFGAEMTHSLTGGIQSALPADHNTITTSGGSFNIDRRAPLASMAAATVNQITMGSDHVEIHINGSNLSPQDVARAVRAEIENHERAKTARARSAFTDRG